MANRPELLDYVIFSETEPEWVNAEGWYYGARFLTVRGEDRVIATIGPDEAEFAFEWWQKGVCRIRVRSVRATQWEIESISGRELLRVTYHDESVRYCELQLKPHIQVDWAMTW